MHFIVCLLAFQLQFLNKVELSWVELTYCVNSQKKNQQFFSDDGIW